MHARCENQGISDGRVYGSNGYPVAILAPDRALLAGLETPECFVSVLSLLVPELPSVSCLGNLLKYRDCAGLRVGGWVANHVEYRHCSI